MKNISDISTDSFKLSEEMNKATSDLAHHAQDIMAQTLTFKTKSNADSADKPKIGLETENESLNV